MVKQQEQHGSVTISQSHDTQASSNATKRIFCNTQQTSLLSWRGHTHTHKYTHMYTLLVRERGDEDGGETVTEDREREKVTFSERAGGGEWGVKENGGEWIGANPGGEEE